MSHAGQDDAVKTTQSSAINLRKLGAWRGIRVLAWDGAILYACRGYQLVRLDARDLQSGNHEWEAVAYLTPSRWRNFTAHNKITYRLMRDGFHALAITSEKETNGRRMIAAVPGAVVTKAAASAEFRITHRILRGTRPLHITAVPLGNIYWGEYFNNRDRAEVHIYASVDRGESWQIAHTFPPRAIRHIHNIVYDRHADCLWILTGDEGPECKILRADRGLKSLEVVLEGNQQARAVAAIPTEDGVYLSTDTPYEQNKIFRLTRTGRVEAVADLPSSSIFGCQTAHALFFTTMVEPSGVNRTQEVRIFGSSNRASWQALARWEKDKLPMRYFQYGNAILPDGENTTDHLAATTIAVKRGDLVTTIWEVETRAGNREAQTKNPQPTMAESQEPSPESR